MACGGLMSPAAIGLDFVLANSNNEDMIELSSQRRTDGLVQITVPQIVDGAARTTHDERPQPKQQCVLDWHAEGKLVSIAGHSDRPS